MKKIILLFFVFVGCHTQKEIIRQEVEVIKPAIISDSATVKPDSLRNWKYVEIVKHDTIAKISYVDKEKKIVYWLKPDSIIQIRTDTTQQLITQTIYSPSLIQKIGWFACGLLLGAVLSLVLLKFKII